MTLAFARQEARRRTEVLGTTHYVVRSRLDHIEFLVLTHVPVGYKILYISKGEGSLIIQRLISSAATRVPTWVDTPYKTLAEARRDNPREYPSWFRRKP